MEKRYSATPNKCKLVKTSPEAMRFLLDYSKSLMVIQVKNIHFETYMN